MTHDFSSGVGQGIDGMAETVYQALVASFEGFIEDLMDDFYDLIVRSLDADASMICSIIKETRMLRRRDAVL
mgnify:CR=1 FL=1